MRALRLPLSGSAQLPVCPNIPRSSVADKKLAVHLVADETLSVQKAGKRSIRLRSSNSQEQNGEISQDDDKLFHAVEGEVKKLLSSKDNQELLTDLQSAVQRAQNARQQLDEVERQQRRAAELKESVKSLEGAQSMIAECMREFSELEGRMRKTELELLNVGTGNRIRNLSSKWKDSDIDENAERIESLKAAGVSAVVGMLGSVPLALFQAKSFEGLVAEVAIVFISCALFGVTYRYTVRQNLENAQLKTGAVAAFALVRGLTQFKVELPLDGIGSLAPKAIETAFAVGESLLAFMFAAISLDYCMKMDVLGTFPSTKITPDD